MTQCGRGRDSNDTVTMTQCGRGRDNNDTVTMTQCGRGRDNNDTAMNGGTVKYGTRIYGTVRHRTTMPGWDSKARGGKPWDSRIRSNTVRYSNGRDSEYGTICLLQDIMVRAAVNGRVRHWIVRHGT